MKFYEIPPILKNEIDDLESAIVRYRRGDLHPTKFRAIRVPFGVYEQRTKNTFMMRIRLTAGGITPDQLLTVAQIAKQYAKPMLHLTTRQELQIHDALLSDIPDMMRALLSANLSCRGGGGNTVRNVTASYDSGINPFEVFDVTPHAVALSSRLIAEPDSWNFPRKFKIAFSSTRKDNALAAFNDLGFIATINAGEKGFKVFTAGGFGCRPRTSKILHEFIPEKDVYRVTLGVKNLFLIHGNRKSKNSARLRFLWEELGEDKFRELYSKETKSVSNKPGLDLNPDEFTNSNKTTNLAPRFIKLKAFDLWKKRFVENQKQEGLGCVTVPIPLGDLSADDAIKLAEVLTHFGENVIRLTPTQNIHLRNIPHEFLGNIFEVVNEINTEAHLPKVYGNMVICAGADTCTTGVCMPRGVAPIIKKYLVGSHISDKLPDGFKMNISGCPNACGQHHVGDLGLYGRVARRNGRALPAYWITGGADRKPETRAFTEKCDWVPSKHLPEAVTDILEHYVSVKNEYADFIAYFKTIGKSEISTICKKYQLSIPDYKADHSFYFDWGASKEFTTTHMGHGECSAGIYDMIEVEMENIRKNIEKLSIPAMAYNKKRILWDIVFSGAGMLLITRGLDPHTESEIFDSFGSYFIDKGLVDTKFASLITCAAEKDYDGLLSYETLIREFGETIIKLYHAMDNTLRFPGEEVFPLHDKPLHVNEVQEQKEPLFKDLRGVACPMNFVKTKVELAKMAAGGRLKILLDDGEPIDNVPRSVISEGHSILEQKKTDGHWTVVIEKKQPNGL